MSIVAIGKLPKNIEESERQTEIMFDGRTIGQLFIDGDDVGRIDYLTSANPEDIQKCHDFISTLSPATNLVEYTTQLYLVNENKEKKLKIMHRKLRKSTLFSVPGKKLQRLDIPYNEKTRENIQKQFPGAIILNTLSEAEAFNHYQANQ